MIDWDSVYFVSNAYAFCYYGNTESLINYKSHMTELSGICTNESFTDVIIVGNFNRDPTKERFYTEHTNLHMTI